MTARICVWAEHAALAGRVFQGDDIESDDIECVERDSRKELVAMAANWASLHGAANAYRIRCGRNILDHLDVVDEHVAMGIIDDLGLELGTAELAWCRVAMDLSNDDGTLSPSAMQRLSNDPRHHTYTSLRAALILIGCREGGAE